MGVKHPETERRIVPRWHSFAATIRRGELSPLGDVHKGLQDARGDFEEKWTAWHRSRSVSYATDLVGSALVLDRPDQVKEAAQFIRNYPRASLAAKTLAERVLDPNYLPLAEDVPDIRETGRQTIWARIRNLRQRLTNDPRNAMAWCDLALDYAVLGIHSRAQSSMNNGLALAPENRFVLRSACRLFVHLDDSEHAHAVLSNSASSQEDPWIMAAEVATASAAGRTSRLLRKARQAISDGGHRPWDLNELSSAVATVELHAGSDKKARKLFRRSLLEPTENAIAQAEWASTRLVGLEVDSTLLAAPESFEARARDAFERRDWKQALAESWEWYFDQPFSSEPAVFGSYAAAVGLQDFGSSAEFAAEGLQANPHDPVLRNNFAVALANLGQLDRAVEEFSQIKATSQLDPDDRVMLLATAGLLSYRLGDIGKGRALYLEAIERASALSKPGLAAVAAMFFAREESLLGGEIFTTAFRRALELEEEAKLPELADWIESLRARAVALGESDPDSS